MIIELGDSRFSPIVMIFWQPDREDKSYATPY